MDPKESILSVPHKLVCVPLNYYMSNVNDLILRVPPNIQLISEEDATPHTDRIRDELAANKLCKGVSEEFIDYALRMGSFVVYIAKSKYPRTIEGLVIVRIKDESLHIELLCGSNTYTGVGSYLIDQVKSIGSMMGKSVLKLKSLTESVGFYLKKGFVCNDLCKMKMELKGGRRTRRNRRRVGRSKSRRQR